MATASASLAAYVTPIAPVALVELCVSVERSRSTIALGQAAAYLVQVWALNGSASNVSVTLASQPASQPATFTVGCASGSGSSRCAVGSVSATKTAALYAQIVVPSSASSVTSVTLTATASVATTVRWTPPSAAETVTVSSAPAASAGASGTTSPGITLPLGPIPGLSGIPAFNSVLSSVIAAGDASGLFPTIAAGTPNASAGTSPAGVQGNAVPVIESSPLASDNSALTSGQIAGLVALTFAVLLAVTRLAVHKFIGPRKRHKLTAPADPPEVPGGEPGLGSGPE